MLMLLAWLSSALAGCELAAPPDAPFTVELPADADVLLLVELWVHPDGEEWARSMLTALDERAVQGAVVVPLPGDAVAPERAAFLLDATSRGHEVVVLLDATEAPRDALEPVRGLRRELKTLSTAADQRVRSVIAPMTSKHTEPLLGQAGMRAILTRNGPATASPRSAKVFEGQPRLGVVIHSGPYAGDCGLSPVSPVWTPAAADRVTQAIHGAAGTRGPAVVRTAIMGVRSAPEDPEVLGRWLDEVILPAGVQVVTPATAREVTMRQVRAGVVAPSASPTATSGRLVPQTDVALAADALAGVTTLPRTLPGRMNPTEAFHAFTLALAERAEGDVVRLGRLDGPRSEATSGLGGPVDVPRADVVALAKALQAEWPAEVPAALPAGGRLFTASELLILFASAVRGEDPSTTQPIAVMDPNAAGLGWGASNP